MPAKPNWKKIRIEYETTKTSYRKLATKYGVSFSTLKERAKRENWQATAEDTRKQIDTEIIAKVTQKVTQKIVEREAEKISASLDIELEAAELISKIALEALRSPQQFNKHLVTKRVKGYAIVDMDAPTETGPVGSDNITVTGRALAEGPPVKSNKKLATVESQETIEQTFDVVDTKRLANLAVALEKAKAIRKEILGIIDAATSDKLDIERKKYELAKQVAEKDAAGDNETYEIVDPFAEGEDDDQNRSE